MPPDPEVLIVGAGVAGLFCAYHLRRRGIGVAVLERGPVGGPQSCSSGNTGFVGAQGAAPLAQPAELAGGGPGRYRRLLDPAGPLSVRLRRDGELLSWLWHFRRACDEPTAAAGYRVLVELKQRSLAMLRELCSPAGSGGLAATFTEDGMVLAFRTAAGFEAAARTVPRAAAHGVPLRVLGAGELAALEPGVDFAVHGALYNPEGGAVHAPAFAVELASLLADRGVEIHPFTEVLDFDVAGERVRQVRTTRGDFRPAETVLAAGSWTTELARRLGVGLELQPVKGYSVTVRMPANAPRRPVLLGEGTVAMAPLGDRLRLAGSLELSGLDGTFSRARVDGLLDTAREFLPSLERTEIVEVWRGFRPCTPDSIPFLGRAAPYRNLTVACGHGTIGMGLAPAAGEVVARIVAGEPPELDLAPFRLGRFGSARRGPGRPKRMVAMGRWR
ncbi:MAG: NAD(P)/FAD-dependent oxidoreductase [Mycobacteriales bacterium]